MDYRSLTHHRLADGSMPGAWWAPGDKADRIDCLLCPRQCSLKPGDRGFCFVRENRDGQMVLSTYGKSTGFCIDPIEKKPLNHFLPGTAVLSFGTAGCNLGCKFCQNWDISKSREVERLSAHAEPETIATAAKQLGCHSVAFTYNDPVVWAEYAIDSAKACHAEGIKTVAVTAGYITPQARGEFFEVMDAANVDLKAFTEEFYHKITYSHLQPVLDTLVYLKRETNCWFEITNLVIPGANDSADELKRMCDYLLEHIGDEVPIHFSAFHPDFRMQDRGRTPHEKLIEAYDIARQTGLKYVYVGNVHDVERQSTYCSGCRQLLIERDWYQLGVYALDGDRCRACQTRIPGRFLAAPGTWGARRQPVRIDQFASKDSTMSTSHDQTAGSRPVVKHVQPLPKLLADQRTSLHRAACRWLAESTLHQPRTAPAQLLGNLSEMVVHGVFVTLKRDEQLRGCCGVLGKPMPLGSATQQATQRTATDDARFASISPTELPYLELDVTLLGPMEIIQAQGAERAAAVEIGKHGLVIQQGETSGLLLPSVATERHWDAVQFLQAVCRKAGLPTDAWKHPNASVMTFEGTAVNGKFELPEGEATQLAAPDPLTNEQLGQYLQVAATNVALMAQGATPSYYVPELPDMTVHAIIVSMEWGEESDRKLGNAIHVSVRPGMPLQSTLFQICQSIAQILNRQRYMGKFNLGLTIGIDPALHGHGADIHIEGVDSKRRGFVINDPKHCAVGFAPDRTPEELIQALRERLPIGSRYEALHSMQFQSTMKEIVAVTLPMPVRGSGSRSSVLGGTFYPAEDAARRAMVDQLLKTPAREKKSALAVMVPHAGLKFSGEVAADAWRSVEIPKTVIIISPKHTQAGVNWAVCPFDRWKLSSSVSFAGDPAVAEALVKNIPGLQFDVAAHEQEHGIEIQLPILERLAPDVRVVGVAVHGGTWTEIDQAAEGLAAALRSLPEMPLLVISSDMNHFADDAENRRLDRIALDAFRTGDPQKLLKTCREQQISMCGVIPAALVMATLHKLGHAFR